MSALHASRRRLAACAALALAGWTAAQAADGPLVQAFPVKAFSYDATEQSPLDAKFRQRVNAVGVATLAERVHAALAKGLEGKTGPLTQHTAGRTFAASMQVTRATSYAVDKGNGNFDVVATVTASLYFSNVLSGEILDTVSRSVVARAVVGERGAAEAERGKLFAQALDTLIDDLAVDAARNFSPTVVDLKVLDKVGELLVLDGGFKKGVQAGDQVSDAAGNLIQVLYTAEGYAVAQPVLADGVGRGAVFQKVLAHASDGKRKPRTAILVETPPQGYSAEFLSQMFSELVGEKAPLSIVQVNPGFTRLLQTVLQQASLGTADTARRALPLWFVRLRVAEPIVYEVRTNLDFQTRRHYETLAFADLVDASGRVSLSVLGKDARDDDIVRGVGPGMAERREVSVKNALVDLADKLGKLAEPRREQVKATLPGEGEPFIATEGRFFPAQDKGTVLRKVKLQLDKQPRDILIPVSEASVLPSAEPGRAALQLGLPFGAMPPLGESLSFEVERVGPTPASSHAVRICGPVESLTPWKTPALMSFASHAVGSRMPAVLYAPEVQGMAMELINPRNGFVSSVKWNIPAVPYCVQPVERVNVGEEICTQQCERPITARYTLRVKAGEDIISRTGFEGQFKSTSFYKQTTDEHLNHLIEADVVDEAQVLLSKVAEKISFTPAK